MTVDEIAEFENIQECNLLKIDVQGGDLRVLKGASKLIERSKRLALLVELYPYGS